MTFIVMSMYKQSVLLNNSRNTSQYLFAFILTCVIAIFIGVRPVSYLFVDMGAYRSRYINILGSPFYFDWTAENLIYDNWFVYMASARIPINTVFILFSFIYYGCIYIACKKLFPKDTLLATLVCFVAFSTFSYATNGMKAGMAASIFLIALAYHDKFWITIPIALISLGMHHAMKLVVVAYIIVLLFRNPKLYFIVWGISFVCAALHITYFQHLFAGFTDEHGASYLLSQRNSGFRIDFIIYSAAPVIVGYYIIYKRRIVSKIYNLILSLYLLTNSVWMLCMYANFTNRIAYLSWFMYPIVLLYPFVNLVWSSRQYTYLKYCVYGHLSFTLFMTFIYY